MKVKIKFLGTFHSVVDSENVELEIPRQAVLRNVLDLLVKKFGEELAEHFRRIDYLMIFINNVEYRGLKGLDTPVGDGDSIVIGHILAGG
ncbi:MAG: MoaD/ThiS family protein [Candidatus Bathyarchaeia archaeon]